MSVGSLVPFSLGKLDPVMGWETCLRKWLANQVGAVADIGADAWSMSDWKSSGLCRRY